VRGTAKPFADSLGEVLKRRAAFALEVAIYNSAHHRLSIARRQPGILMHVHSVIRRISNVWRHQLTS
jgi:hypothetical protein